MASLSDADGSTLFGKEEDRWPSPVGAAAEDSWRELVYFWAPGCAEAALLQRAGFPRDFLVVHVGVISERYTC